MDIDLLGTTDNDVDAIVATVRDICTQEVEPDGLVFDPASAVGARIAEDSEYAGVRVRFGGTLGTARIAMQVDVGFGDVVMPKPEMAAYPVLLDLPAPNLKGYSRESAVAEKFEVMIKRAALNTRVKDFYDIWLLSRQFDFDGRSMALAMAKTFGNRGTPIDAAPIALTSAFANEPARQSQWQGFVRRSRLPNAPASFAEVVETIADFLGPIAQAFNQGEGFDGWWTAPGPWRRGTKA